MKRLFRAFLAPFLALALIVVLIVGGGAIPVFATEFVFASCTLDNKAVTLKIDMNDALSAQHPAVNHIQEAFSKAANSLPAVEFLSEVGYYTFVSGLDKLDVEAVNALLGNPEVTGTCKSFIRA